MINYSDKILDAKYYKKTKTKTYEVYVCKPKDGTEVVADESQRIIKTTAKEPFIIKEPSGRYRVTSEKEITNKYRFMRDKEITIPLVKGDTEDDYLMWFTGYLYKYWMTTRNLDRRQVYKILPFDKMIKAFDFYHTQDLEYVVEEATRVYNERLEKRKIRATKSTT